MINICEEKNEKSNYDFNCFKKERTVLANAFSVNMLKHDGYYFFAKIDLEMAIYFVYNAEVFSIIGHQSTAYLLSAKLGIPVEANRINYVKQKGDRIIVCLPAQRLEEGKILTLEELNKIEIKFWLVK